MALPPVQAFAFTFEVRDMVLKTLSRLRLSADLREREAETGRRDVIDTLLGMSGRAASDNARSSDPVLESKDCRVRASGCPGARRPVMGGVRGGVREATESSSESRLRGVRACEEEEARR